MTLLLLARRSALLNVALVWLSFVGFSTSLSAGTSLGLSVDLVREVPEAGTFPLLTPESVAPLWVDEQDFPGVQRVVKDLAEDVWRVSGRRPEIRHGELPRGQTAVVIGSLGRSRALDQLVQQGKLSVEGLAGRWESFVITTVEQPWPGLERALVIVGSDKRGAIYGTYEMSEQLGVSPWYWWADVTPERRDAAYILPGVHASGEPVVRYRGIFLNNEAPCLTGWTKEKFGGMNSAFYTKVFELLLRLRANYLWPAMWQSAFNEDDPANPRLADEYGIVMGTSHHEPMMRAHQEWTRRREQYGNGKWNFATNAEAIERFFREGIRRNGGYENLITVGMRGDGDEGLVSTGSDASDMALLEKIFSTQRRIIREELKTDPAKVPQLWALFTEVQKYYELGLRPPEDVTLLWTDDNTGSLRRLPTAEERQRSGGAGIYYHFDMHGGPFAFQWINTMPLPKIGEQMNLAYEYGATRIWIVNVGDLKPLELPIEFFLRLAWNPPALNKDQIDAFLLRWAQREFGPTHAAEIAEIVRLYTKYNGWRKPELIKPDTFSPVHFREAERVEEAWAALAERAEAVAVQLPSSKRAAFYQLVLHPTVASGLVAQMNILAGRNRLHAEQGRASANNLGDRVRELFRRDQALSDYYNHTLSGGKWNHLMDQAHLGQFSWEPPVVNVMPSVTEVIPEASDRFGVAIEGDVNTWPDHFGEAVLPTFDGLQPRRSYVDVFANGSRPLEVDVKAVEPWILLAPTRRASGDLRYEVEINWGLVPPGSSHGMIKVKGRDQTVTIKVPVLQPTEAQRIDAKGTWASLTGTLAFPAAATSQRTAVEGARWELIPDLGRGRGALGVYPVTTPSRLPPAASPRLDYDLFLPTEGEYQVTLVLGPVMDFVPERGMRIAVSFDEDQPQVLDIFADRKNETFLSKAWWSKFTQDNVRSLRSRHTVAKSGRHTLKLALVDPGVVVERVIVSRTPLPSSYFGPPDALPQR